MRKVRNFIHCCYSLMALSYLPPRRLRRLQQHATVGPLQGSFRGHKLIKVNDQQMNVTSPLHKLRLGANRPGTGG